jgi:AmmeMemoRadiSam system protein A
MPMSHLPHSPSASAPSPIAEQEFSADERSLLLRLAHDSIESSLEGREISFDPPSVHLSEPRGVFTSLYKNGRLRGCVGYVLPVCAVYRAVAETARAAAFDDSRFPRLTKEELPHLQVELSVLTPPRPILPDEVKIGRHGLLVSHHGRRGLLLPQVPVEHNWDRKTFLEQVCRKAGLPIDAWTTDAALHGFTAEIFGEKSENDFVPTK